MRDYRHDRARAAIEARAKSRRGTCGDKQQDPQLAFWDAEKLAQHPDIDLVTVSVKVPDHAMSATFCRRR